MKGHESLALSYSDTLTPSPLFQDSPYGLSFVKFHSPPDKDEAEATSQVSCTWYPPEPLPASPPLPASILLTALTLWDLRR